LRNSELGNIRRNPPRSRPCSAIWPLIQRPRDPH
jgi:hypothetical protein